MKSFHGVTKDAAKIIGCCLQSMINWEKGWRRPQINQIGKVVEFLGYDPFPEGTTLAERLVNYRKTRGVRQKDFARQLGIDPSTLARFERGERYPTGKYLSAIRDSRER